MFTDWSGHSAQEVEDQVTYPLTTGLQGLAGVRVVRSQSAFGFSMVYVVFEDRTDLYFARSRVLERMNLLASRLPAGVVPTLGPDATGVGHVFWYTVEGPGRSLRELRSIQDWFIRYQLNAVPGVAEVASIGGTIQQYQIDVDPDRLRAYGVPLSAVVSAIRESNRNVGGNVLDANGAWAVVRGVGLVGSAEDLENVVIGASAGVPVYIRQVATVRIGDAFRVASLVKGSGGSGGRRHRRAVRRQHAGGDRGGQSADRPDRSGTPERRHHRPVLRPLRTDPARHRHAAHGPRSKRSPSSRSPTSSFFCTSARF